MKNDKKTFADIILDMRQRAAVALRQDADAMIHHNAVGGMLSALAYEAEAAHKREVEKLRGVIAGLREKMGDDDLLKMARDIGAKDAEIEELRELLLELSYAAETAFDTISKCGDIIGTGEVTDASYREHLIDRVTKWRKALKGATDERK